MTKQFYFPAFPDIARIAENMSGSVKYDENAEPVKTYCSECGAVTGEEQPHAKDCGCAVCNMNRMFEKSMVSVVPRRITFRRFEGIGKHE